MNVQRVVIRASRSPPALTQEGATAVGVPQDLLGMATGVKVRENTYV